MREIVPGLRHWRSPHPEWADGDAWPREVSSYAWDRGTELLLIDPLGVPEEVERLIPERDAAIVLTAPWHERDARALVERFGLPVHAPRPDGEDDLMRKYAVPRERVVGGSPDLAWLVTGGEPRFFSAGEGPLPGVKALAGSEHNDLLLWLDEPRALVAGDTLVDVGAGVELWEESLPADVTREGVLLALRPVLDLPVEHLLPTHGDPTDRGALERALR